MVDFLFFNTLIGESCPTFVQISLKSIQFVFENLPLHPRRVEDIMHLGFFKFSTQVLCSYGEIGHLTAVSGFLEI